jgi:hypothetical protein
MTRKKNQSNHSNSFIFILILFTHYSKPANSYKEVHERGNKNMMNQKKIKQTNKNENIKGTESSVDTSVTLKSEVSSIVSSSDNDNIININPNINISNNVDVNNLIVKFEKMDLTIDNENVLPMKEWDDEQEFGNTEYKLKLCRLTAETIQHRVTQMEFRLREGYGECFYIIGVEDNGNPLGIKDADLKESIEALNHMTKLIGAKMTVLNFYQGKKGKLAEIKIKKEKEYIAKNLNETRIGLIGEEGSGKSTLVIF